MNQFVIDPYPRNPGLTGFVPDNPLVARSVVSRSLLVVRVLGMGALANILSAIVQGVVILMVNLITNFAGEYLPVHPDSAPSLFSFCIKTVRSWIPTRNPIPTVEPFIVSEVNNSVLPLRKWDKAVGFVERLDNGVSLNTSFHLRTSNANLIPAATLP